uniref:DUF1618 domain-containing protein n=1 Tax=Leersia perrieri TaxID=77586 RepID=A0A0D9VR49_9ORYZ
MAPPPFVLLKRLVEFLGGEEFTDDAGILVGWSTARHLSRGEAMEAMKAKLYLAELPQVSHMDMISPTPAHAQQMGSVPAAEISSTHKGVVVMYADFYRPGSDYSLYGRHLLYNASTNSLIAIPRLPQDSRYSPDIVSLGRSAVLVPAAGDDDDGYVLAEIVTSYEGVNPGLPDATIFTIKNPENVAVDGREWVQSSTPQLPLPADLCGPDYYFQIDMAFSFQGRICWVDLLKGILFCDDVLSPQGPNLSFVSLPLGYSINCHCDNRHQMVPLLQRSMSCVNGAIKFVALVGFGESSPDQVMLRTWVLSPNFKDWKEDTAALSVEDIWDSDSYKQTGLPQLMPVSPVLSLTENGVMYAILNEFERLPQVAPFRGPDGDDEVVAKANYMIRFNILQNKVLTCTKLSADGDLEWMMPDLIATDFTAYLEDHKIASSELITKPAEGFLNKENSRCKALLCDEKVSMKNLYAL